MKRNFLKGLTACSAIAGSTAALITGMGQPSQALPGVTFSCSNPGSGLEVFPGSPNALIATPDGATAGFPAQANIVVFGDVLQKLGNVATGDKRCFDAMNQLNGLNPPVGTKVITYEPLSNGSGITGATLCLVPISAAGVLSCDGGIKLFTISQNPNPIQTAANIAMKLNSPGSFAGGSSSISRAQVDGYGRVYGR